MDKDGDGDVMADTVDEPNESFSLTLAQPTAATISDVSGIGFVTDDDGPVTMAASTFLAVDNLTLFEGHVGATAATFTVTRSGITSGAATVTVATSDGLDAPATAGSDDTPCP